MHFCDDQYINDKQGLRYLTLADLLRWKSKDPHLELDAADIKSRVEYALSDNATTLERLRIFQISIYHYNGTLDQRFETMFSKMMTEDQGLAIDAFIDVWSQTPIELNPRLLPFLATTQHPERLRQLLGAMGSDMKVEIDLAIDAADRSEFYSTADRIKYRNTIISGYSAVADALKRFHAMRHRNDDIPEFLLEIDADLQLAHTRGVLSDRHLAKIKRTFAGLPGMPSRAAIRSHSRLHPEPKR
jgi:hypothetical protein